MTCLQSSFYHADLTGCILASSTFHKTNFTKANLSDADMMGVRLAGTKNQFIETILAGAVMHRITATQTEFSNAVFDMAELDDADFSGSKFDGVILSKEQKQIIGLS